MDLVFDFSEDEFISICTKNIQRNRTTIYQDIYESITHFLCINFYIGSDITEIKHFKRDSSESFSLQDYLNQEFIQIHSLRFDVLSVSPLSINSVVIPDYIKITRPIIIKEHKLKTKNKISIEIHWLQISSDVINKIVANLDTTYSNIQPSTLGAWEWKQTFYEKITGEVFFCKCFEIAIQKNSLKELNYNNHIHLKAAIENKSFRNKVCHLCSGTNSDLFYCNKMYGSDFKVRYGAYIKKLTIEQEINERDAENIVREQKGVAKIGEKWVNETLLFNYIQVIFSQYSIEREASPIWLGKQRLDIYIPEINLAIEYQGKQHFKAIDIFGGKEGLRITKERDKEKLTKCIKNNVKIIYFDFQENLSEKLVVSKLGSYLKILM